MNMALPICTNCEEREGLLMATMLTDGDTKVVCGSCITLYVLTLAAVLTEGMAKPEAEAYAEQLDAIYSHDPRPIARPAARAKAKAKAPPDDADRCPVCKQRSGQHSKWCSADLSADNPGAPGPTAADHAAGMAAAGLPLNGAEPVAVASVALVPPCDLCGSMSGHGDALTLVCDECGSVIATEGTDGTPGVTTNA